MEYYILHEGSRTSSIASPSRRSPGCMSCGCHGSRAVCPLYLSRVGVAGVVAEALEFVGSKDSDGPSTHTSGPWQSFQTIADTTTSHGHSARGDSSYRVTMRGFVDLVSVTMVGDGRAASDAPHRRLARMRETGGTVASEHVSTWYMAVHHTAFGSLNVNCSAQLVTGSDKYVDTLAPRTTIGCRCCDVPHVVLTHTARHASSNLKHVC
jgi:hypothetical protein